MKHCFHEVTVGHICVDDDVFQIAHLFEPTIAWLVIEEVWIENKQEC